MPTQYRTRQASEYRRNIAKLQSDLSKHLGALSELIRILSVVVVVVVVVAAIESIRVGITGEPCSRVDRLAGRVNNRVIAGVIRTRPMPKLGARKSKSRKSRRPRSPACEHIRRRRRMRRNVYRSLASVPTFVKFVRSRQSGVLNSDGPTALYHPANCT